MNRLFPILITLFLTVPLLHCTSPEVDQQPAGKDMPTQESWDSDIYFTQLGTLNAVVHAGHIMQFGSEERTILHQKVKADFYKNNAHTSTLFADSAVIWQQDQMEAFGNVKVESDSGVTLYTPQLAYDQKTAKITSDSLVTITTDVDTLHGQGFVSKPDLSDWVIREPRGVTWRELQNKDQK